MKNRKSKKEFANATRDAFIIREFLEKPTCGITASECNPAEHPSHHVEIRVQKWVLDTIRCAQLTVCARACGDGSFSEKLMEDLGEVLRALKAAR